MTTRFSSERDFNELIFENRNKNYGAYEMRSTYKDSITKSLAITITALSLLIGISLYINRHKLTAAPPIDSPVFITEQWTEVVLPETKKAEPPKSQTKEKLPPPSDNIQFKATNDPVVPEVKAVVLANPGLGNKGDSAQPEVIVPPFVPPVEIKTPPQTITVADEMPEFNGDVYKWIRDHLRYPQEAIYNKTEGTSYISFIVDTDGSIGEIKILGKKVGDGCSEEAARVVKSMPRWKPGKNKGQLVRVVVNIPIRFKLQ
jgi:periplasmic protein TonB